MLMKTKISPVQLAVGQVSCLLSSQPLVCSNAAYPGQHWSQTPPPWSTSLSSLCCILWWAVIFSMIIITIITTCAAISCKRDCPNSSAAGGGSSSLSGSSQCWVGGMWIWAFEDLIIWYCGYGLYLWHTEAGIDASSLRVNNLNSLWKLWSNIL